MIALPRTPKLLVLGACPESKVSFGVTLNEVYKTGRLQEYFDVSQLVVGRAKPGTAEVHDVRLYWSNGQDEHGTKRLAELLACLQPDLVLLHGEIGHFVVSVSVLREWAGPVVGWFPVNFERETNPYPWSSVLGRCDRVMALSEFGRRQLRRECAEVELVSLGVNLDLYRPVAASDRWALRAQLGWATHGFVFLYVGRNNARKGVEFALEAFRIYCATDPGAANESYLYFHTELDRRLAELVHAGGLTRRVWFTTGYDVFTNPLPEHELARIYQASDVLVLTSSSEGFGMPLLEAQAFGLPIIATNNSAIPEVVGQAGLLIDAPLRTPAQDCGCTAWARPPDVDHAAELMHRMYNDEALRESCSRQGLKQAATRSWLVTAEKLLASMAPLGGSRV